MSVASAAKPQPAAAARGVACARPARSAGLSFQTTPLAASLPGHASGIVLVEEQMLMSVMALPRMSVPERAFSAFFGILFLSLAGDPSPAQVRDPLPHHGEPGQVREVIAPAVTVARTHHYQAELMLNCIPNICSGAFPKPGKRRRLNITRISCFMLGPPGTTFRNGTVELENADQSHVLNQHLPVDHTAPDGVFTLNRAIDVQVIAAQHLRVALILADGIPDVAQCTATGTLDVLAP